MAMYKTIFVSEEYQSSSENIVGINGEVLMFGENAFASVEQALGSGVENAIVIKVQSGKYDGFAVVADGKTNTDVTVMAVDFDGGEVMVGGENLTVADSGIAAADQATLLADLNDINAGNGKVFVAASEATADMPTIYVGMGEAGYVAGAAATVITAQDTAGAAEILNTMYSTTVEAAATSGAVSISKDYTSADEGWGSTKFANWSSAYSNTTGSATITVEANSGNAGYIGDSSNKVGRNVIVESGSSLYVQRRLLKIDKTMTFKAGASFVDNHVPSVPNPYTHIDGGKLYVGEANSTVRATMNFKDNSIATLYSAIFEANNADILLGDFASVGRTSFTDSDITVNGSLSFGAHQSQSSLNGNSTMTNSTMTVKGHDMRNDTTYFANDFNRIAALVMDKSTITINDGADGTAAAAVQLGYKGSWVKKSLTLKNNSNIIVESGTAVTALWDVTLENSTIKAGALTIQDGSFKLTGTANMDLTSLTIADGKTLTMDSSSTLTLDSLSATGKIVVNMVEGFDGKKMFDFSNAGISSLPANIEINGGYAEIVDGDIYVYAGAKAEVDLTGETNKVDLSANGAKLTDAVGSNDKDIEISTGDDNSKPAVTETAKLNADITGKDVKIDNSKKLEVTGSINAEGAATITNSGENIYDKDGKLVAEATFNGGYDADGKELAAKVEAEKIVMQNDGHANVDFGATNIVIANNSNETLTGIIGTADTESVEIAAGTATADGVTVSGNGDVDGTVEDSVITATTISLDNQKVIDSELNGKVTVTGNSEFTDVTVTGSNLFVKDNFTARGEVNYKQVNFYGETVVKDGAVLTGGTTIVSAGSDFTLEDGAEINSRFFNVISNADIYGDINLEHSDPRQKLLQIHEDGVANIKEGAAVTITRHNAIVKAGGTLNVDGGDLIITADTVNVAPDRGGNIYNSGAVNVTAGLVDIKNLTNDADATVAISGGTVNISDTLTNNGTFTVAGDSTLKIADLSGSYIRALDGTTLTDTTIASTTNMELVVGEDDVASTVTFDGANSIAKISAGNGDKIVVTADGSLALTGARSGFGSGAEWDIDGNIADAKAVTAEEKAAMTADLHLVQGLSISDYSGAESVMNVDNAYFKFNNQISTKNDNSAGGKFTMNFTNSIVDSTAKIAINRSKDSVTNAPEIEMNFKDSAVNIGNYFTNNHEKSTVTIDNTDFTATAFGNTGKFDVKNGSDVEFSPVNAVGDWQSKGSLNAGDISVDNADLTINNSGASLDFYNVGDITLSNGASLTIDKLVNAAANDVTAGSINTIFADQVGNIEVADATLVAGTLTNNGTFTVSGESTLKIANLSGDADITDAELQDGSYITNGDGTIYFNGSNAIDGAVTIGSEIYNYGKLDVKDGATFTNQSGEITYLVGTGASLNVAENATVKVNDLWNNVQGSAVSMIDGTVEISHNAWLRNATINGSLSVENQLAVYSNDAFNVNGELTINGNGSPAGWLIGNPGSSTGAYAGNITVNVTGGTVNVTGNSTGEEIIIQQYGIFNINSNAQGKAGTVSVNGIITNKGDVNITDGSMTSNYKITNSGTMNVTDGVVTASSITNTGTINLTVTAEKLATVGNDAYYLINQTGSGAALNETVNYNGTEYVIGDKITIGDIVYTVTSGTGNDIAIEALATVFFVDASYDENTVGYGFNKFSSFDDAVKALKNNDTVIKLLSDAEMSETTDPSFKLNVVSGDGSKHTLKINDATIDVDANFAKEIDIDTDLFMAYYNNHNVVVDGDLKGGIYNYGGTLTLNNSKITDCWDNNNIFGVVNINGDGTWTLDNAQADNLKFIGIGRNSSLNQGILNLNDTVVKAIQYTVDSQSANTKSQINAVNSTIGTVLNDGGWGHLVITANGEVNLTNSNLNILGTLTNNGEINVTGTGDLVAKVTGNGWVYMDGVTLDADTKLTGANVRFASGVNTIDGATIDNGKFQIGQGQYNNTDSRIDMDNGITVNVKNNAVIGAVDGDYNGWIGTGYYDSDAEKLANMTDARYTLNIDNSTASFGYLHISNDGIMNVNGVADTKVWYNNSDYSFYTGRLIINGAATFDAADTLVDSTIVSSDNGTDNGGHLVITNGTYYEAESHDGADDYRVNLDVRKTGVVDVNGGSTLYVGGKVNVAENAVININDANFKATGTVTNAGTIDVSDSTFAADTFNHKGSVATFTNVDLDVTNFVNGTGNGDAYAVIGGNSKVQIDNLSGYYALRLADGTTLKGGTNIVGATSVRAQGDVTFGETATDVVHIDSFDNNNAGGYTITVNGTLNTNASNVAASSHWFGISGGSNGAVTTLTGNGTINSNGFWNIFQYGAIEIEEGLTINIADSYARDLRFTNADVTLNGVINQNGNNNKLTSLKSANLTISGANAALNVDDYLLVGYNTYYAGGSDTTDAYKSTVTLKDGAELNVGGRLIINQGSSITIDATSSFSAGTIENNGGMINSTEAGTIVLNNDMTVSGVISTGSLVLNSGVELTVGSLDVDSLTMVLGSSITITGNTSAIDSFTVIGDILGDNQYNLVLSGWQESFGSVVSYKGTEYTIVTDTTTLGSLAGINFVAIDGNLYLKDFGAATANIYIGDDVANWTAPVTIDGVEYVKGKNAFASVSDVTGIDVDEITSITLGSGEHMNDATSLFPSLSQVIIPNADALVVDSDIANFSGNVVIINHGHMDVKLVANGTLDVTNTSVNTMLGSYTAEWISVDNTGRIGDATQAVTTLTATIGDIEIANSGTDAIVENVELVTDGNVYLSGSGFGEGISVKAFNLSLYGADIALENSTVETIYMTENSSFEYADGGELTLKAGSVIGKVNGYNGDTDKATGTVIFDGANLTDTAVQDVSKVVLASGTAHSIGKDSVFNDYREFYTEELNIASGAAFNFEHNDTSAADLHIGTTVSVDGTRVAVTGNGAMNVSNDGSEAYSMDNFDVSGFAGTLNVATGSLVALEEDEDHVAATGTVNADGTVELNGTTVADIDFAITGAGSVKVNENKNFTGDISAYTGEYVIADDKTATYTAAATLASDMTINGEGTADFADRTNPATVTLMSDTTTTPDIKLNSNSAKLNGGAFGSIKGDADLTVIADSTAQDVYVGTMTVKAGQEFDVAGDGVDTFGAVVATGDITLEGGSETDRTVLNAEYIGGNNITAGDYVTATSTDSIEAHDTMTFGNNATVTAINDISAQNDMIFGDNAKVSADKIFTYTGAISAGDGANVSGFSKLESATTITFGDDATLTAAVDGSSVPAGDVTAVNDITFGDNAKLTVKDIEVTGTGDMTFGETAKITANDVSVYDGSIEIGNGANIDINTFKALNGDITIGDNSTVNVVAESGSGWTNTLNIGAASNVDVTNDIVVETLNIGAGTSANVGGDIWAGNDAGEGIFAADNVKVSAANIYGKEIEFGDTAQVTVTKYLSSSSDITFGSSAEVTAKHITADNNITFGDNATVNASGNISGNDVGSITFGDNSEVTVGGDIEATHALTTDPATGSITFGAENTVDVTGRISAVNAINVGVATELTAGKIYTPGALNISEHAKVTTNDIDAANINISILVPDASGFTGPSITLTAAVAKEKLGTLTIDADRSDFVSPYTVIDGVSSQLYNDLLVFVVGSESVNLNVNTAVAQEIAGYWVYGYVDNGDLLLDRMVVDNGEIFVNSDWTDNKGDRFYWGGNDVAHQHIVGNDAAKTLGYAASIVRAKADGSASNIYIVKGDTYEVDDLTLMTVANGVSKLVLSGDEVEAGTPDVAAGDALILGNLYATDGSSATSLTLNNIAVKGNFFGGANNVALGGDVSTVINNASTAAAMRGMVFGGSNITSDIDDSDYSSTISLIGGGYSGSMIGGGAYVDGATYYMADSTISVAAGEGGERTVISGRLFGGSVAANGATVTQESANINIDLSNGQVYLRNDVYAAGANISGGSVNVAEANVAINGDLSNLNFTGRLSGGVYGTAIGSAANTVSDLTFSDATGTFKGLIQDFDTITISGNSAVTFSRKQTLTADTGFVFDLNGRTSADAMFTVNSFGWTYGDTITINAFDGVSGDYTLIGNWSDSYGVNLMIGSTAATIGSTATVNGNDYTLNVVNDALVLSYVGNNGVGLVDGAELSFTNQTIAAGSDGRALSFDGSGDYTDGTVNLTDSTVDGDVYTGRYGEVTMNTQGNTTIKGDISGYENLFELTVESGKTTIEGTLSSGKGDDKVVVAAGAELAVKDVSTGTNDDLIEISGTMNVTNDIVTGTDEDKINVADGASLSAAVIEMGTGDDTLVVGKNATLTATKISGGTGNDHLTLEKGAFVTANDVETVETMSIDVDSVLNAGNYSWSTKPLTVTGVAGLTTDVAGAKTIFTNCKANKAINFDGVDAVLGTATQIAGTATTADTSDDVWASLSKVGNNLVVSWGRTETECGAALDAFKADTTLNLGEALVAVDDSLLNGFDSTDNTTKKSNGTLA